MITVDMDRPTSVKSYLICTLPRSGSWLLCDMLAGTNIAGTPFECFHASVLKSDPHRSARQHIRRAVRNATGWNGVFGGKVHWSQFRLLIGMRDCGGLIHLQTMLSEELPQLRYVWLTRRDKARQAISYCRAIQSGKWWRYNPGESAQGVPELRFDFDLIERYERMLVCQESRWQAFFEELDIDPVLVVYEELAANPGFVLTETLHGLDLALDPNDLPVPRLLCQSDALSEEWFEQYQRMKAGQFNVPVYAQQRQADAAHQIPVMNAREIRIAAVQRSGHHGVVNWIAGQCQGRVLFLNDVQPGTNPFFTSTIATSITPAGITRLPRPHIRPFMSRDCLIHNYEDRELSSVFSDAFEAHHDEWVGRSAERFDLIVLRDPFNTFASRIRASWMRYALDDETARAALIAMWKGYAREALGETRLMRCRPVIVIFNRWAQDIQYRQEISAALGLPFSDGGFRKVSAEYGGSSFDGTRFDGQTENMRLMERWRHYADEPLFAEIFADLELIELSEALFGHIPGTERLGRRYPERPWTERDQEAPTKAAITRLGDPAIHFNGAENLRVAEARAGAGDA
jgi:LPS sulfotransferase NodH